MRNFIILLALFIIFMAIVAPLPLYFAYVFLISPIVSFFASFFNYDYACYDLHGGNKCKFERKLSSKKSSNTYLDIGCTKDKDCISTDKGLCVSKKLSKLSTFKGKYDGNCKCLQGPVYQGCVPKDSELLKHQ